MRKKKIDGYEQYAITDTGKVFKGNLELRPQNTHGYRSVGLWKNGESKTVLVHRLVANAFLRPRGRFYQVNHKNGIKSDNRAINLEWTNHSGNQNHAVKTGLSRARRVYAFNLSNELVATFSSINEAARETGVKYRNLFGMLHQKGRRHRAGKFRFSFEAFLKPLPHLPSRKKHTKLKGAFWDNSRKKWRAYIYHDGKQHNLGSFNTDKEAHMAYLIGYKRLKTESI